MENNITIQNNKNNQHDQTELNIVLIDKDKNKRKTNKLSLISQFKLNLTQN